MAKTKGFAEVARRDMPAGPEMDALIAELVMGWKWAVDECEHPTLNDGRCLKPDGIVVYFRPSRQIADAWQVVEYLRGQPWYRGVSVTDAPTQGGSYTCEIWTKRGGMMGREVEYVADTAPLAICRAALKVFQSGSGSNV